MVHNRGVRRVDNEAFRFIRAVQPCWQPKLAEARGYVGFNLCVRS